MDFTKYELSDELRATLTTDYETDVLGLKNKNTDLIQRMDSLKSSTEEQMIELVAKEEAAKVSLAEKDGNIENYKNALANEKEALETVKREFKESESNRILSDSVNEFSSVLANDPAGKMYMQKLFQDSVEVSDGIVKPKDTTKTMEDLKQSLISDKANANYIAANVGSGTGSAGSQSSGSSASSTNKNFTDLKSTAEKVAYLEAKG